jgi:hypothetical protein
MANDNLRSIHCKAEHVWSERYHKGGSQQYQQQHEPDPNAILEIKEGKARKITIVGHESGQHYHMIAESQDSLHFDGDYEDSVDDKGDVHFKYYRNGGHHCFVGHYVWDGDGGTGYTGLYYIELEEIEENERL